MASWRRGRFPAGPVTVVKSKDYSLLPRTSSTPSTAQSSLCLLTH